jgi:hypothetical protein
MDAVKSLFPIGDLHIHTQEEVIAFADYLNQRPEILLILLGDIIHFANSFWSPKLAQMGREDLKTALKNDFKLWEDFFRRLKKPTILYYGTHEMFVLETCSRVGWPLFKHPWKINKRVTVPTNCEELELPTDVCVAGVHIPSNVNPADDSKFHDRKKIVDNELGETLRGFKPKKPNQTIICTHDPTDFYYTNMGYGALTKLLKKFPFRTHHHAHIHSNLREHIVGVTPTINRSFQALRRFKREVLEPLPDLLNEPTNCKHIE